MGRRPTIQMVADRAGVSRGTVDRVLNNRSYVKEAARARVRKAIEEVGYVSPSAAHQMALEGREPLRLGVLLPNWTGHFRTEIERGIETARAELQDFGVQVLTRECRTEVPGEAMELLDDLLAQDVRGVALCAVNDLSIEQKIAEMHRCGIPVVTFNSDLPTSRRICFIGQDYEKSGRIAAELMSKCVPARAGVLAMVGNMEFDGHRRRLEGFCARMRALGFATSQIEVEETFNDYATTYKKVQDALRHTPCPAGIYMANRSVGGCVEAVKAAGKTGQIRVIAHDMSETTRRLLREGSLDLTISQDLYGQGYQPLIILRELLQKAKMPRQAGSPIAIYCAENVDL